MDHEATEDQGFLDDWMPTKQEEVHRKTSHERLMELLKQPLFSDDEYKPRFTLEEEAKLQKVLQVFELGSVCSIYLCDFVSF